MSTRKHSTRLNRDALVQPAERFVTDLTSLIRDVDRLMVDIRSTNEKERTPNKTNGDARRPTLNGSISTLQEHARSFVKSLGHFGLLHDRVPVPYLELDAKARILGTNEECAGMLNGSATTLPGKSLFSLVAAPDIKRLREHLAIARQTNKPCAVYVSMAHNGKTWPALLRIRRQLVGGEIGYVAVVESTDQWQEAHRAPGLTRKGHPSMHELVVNLSRAQSLRSMADTVGNHCSKAFGSAAGMIFVERNGDLQLVSQWGASPISKKHLADERIKKGPVARAFRTGAPVFWRQEHRPHSNIYRYLCRLLPQSRCRSVTFVPINALGQRPVGVLAIVLPYAEEFAPTVRDDLLRLGQIISGCFLRARTYEETLAARVKAENDMRRKDEFLSILSHELKNLMMPILGWAVALSSGTLPTDKQNFALEGIVRNVRALNYLIEDLFDVERISSGKLRLQPAEIRIQEVAREALTAIQHTAEGKKLRISTDISEAIPPFFADPRRLFQVLMNLLNNAVKFTPGGGSVSLKVLRRRGSVECIVSDTGRGIEPKFLPFVFDRFRQENRSSKIRATGLGLGLAIVREIVALHGGSIKAYSAGTDKGSTFTLRLPLRRRHGQSRIANLSRRHAAEVSAIGKKIPIHPK